MIPIIKLFLSLFKNNNDTDMEVCKDYIKDGVMVTIQDDEVVVRTVPFSGLKQLLTLTDAEVEDLDISSSKPLQLAIYYDDKEGGYRVHVLKSSE